MMDLTLGGEVDTGETSELHSGTCNDGVFGCSRCWNAANEGQGTEFECDLCRTATYTRVTLAWDEPVLYAMCADCRIENRDEAEEDEDY